MLSMLPRSIYVQLPFEQILRCFDT